MPRGDQLSRQWRLLQLIDRPQGVTVDDAAAELGCAVRTIWRDLKTMQTAGFPIYDDKGADGPRSAWKVTESFKRSLPLKLTMSEVIALSLSQDLLAPAGVSALGPAVTTAFDKVRAVLHRDALKSIEEMR